LRWGRLRTVHFLIHFLVLLIEHFFYLVYKIFSIDGREVRDLLHKVDDKRQGKALLVDYSLFVGGFHVFQFLEGVIVGVAEIEVNSSLFLLLRSIDLDIRQSIGEGRVAELRPFLFLREHHYHDLGHLQLAIFVPPRTLHVYVLQVEVVDVELRIALKKLILMEQAES
jgi:hypothetical protein